MQFITIVPDNLQPDATYFLVLHGDGANFSRDYMSDSNNINYAGNMPVVQSLLGNNPEGQKWHELYEEGEVAFFIPNWVLKTQDKNQSDTLTDDAIQYSFTNFIEACGGERTSENTAIIGFSRGSGMSLQLVSREYQDKHKDEYPSFAAAQIGSNSSTYHFSDDTKVLVTYGGNADYQQFGSASNGKYWGWAQDNDNLDVLLLDGKYGTGIVPEHQGTLRYQGSDDIAMWFIESMDK